MKLDIKAAALASGIFWAIVAFLCAIFVGMWPAMTMNFFSSWSHMNAMGSAGAVTVYNFFGSIVASFVMGLIGGGFFAWLYNKFIG